MGSMSVALLQWFEVLQSQVADREGRSVLIAWSQYSQGTVAAVQIIALEQGSQQGPCATEGFGLDSFPCWLCAVT